MSFISLPGRSRSRVLALLTTFLLAGCALAKEPTPPPSAGTHPEFVELGREAFMVHCASCHGVEARGDGPVAASLSPPPADLTRIAARRGGTFPELDIAYIIDGRFELPAHGTRDMPVWGSQFLEDLPPNEWGEAVVRGRISTLVEYLVSIQEPPVEVR